MRISVVPGDPGQIEYAKIRNSGRDVRVFLDGVLVGQYCRTADDQEGFVEVYTGESTTTEWIKERRTGLVRIEIFDRTP